MATIFKSILHPDFWHRTIISPDTQLPAPLYSSTLITKLPNSSEVHSYELYPGQILCTNPESSKFKFADLFFVTLTPFTLTSNSTTEFGFSLNNKEFFVSSESELNIWLNHLRPMCILNNLEEDFVILKTIGKGSTCTVYLATSLEDKKYYAIKSLPKDKILNHPSGLDNLLFEISIQRNLNHPNIAKLFYVYESNDTIDMVTEYLPGGSLCDLVNKQKRLKEVKCKKFGRKMLETLFYLNQKNVVHRDLKLENIILTGNGEVEFKIIDFGLAFEGNKEGARCGSPGYVAPEVMLNDNYDSKIDVYSTGVILYVLLCGKHPFADKNEDKILKKNIKGKYSICKDLSEDAKNMLRIMMEPDPFTRPDAKQLLETPWFAIEKDSESALITS